MAADFWTNDRVNELIKLWNSDWASQRLADHFGMSRSAIVGKVYRLRRSGIPLRAETTSGKIASSSFQHTRKRIVQARTPARVKVVPSMRDVFLARLRAEVASAPKETERRVPKITDIMELDERACRWPIGQPREPGFGYCGDERVKGAPYCREHFLRSCRLPEMVNRIPARAKELEPVSS